MEEVGEDNVEGDHDQDDNGVDYDSAVISKCKKLSPSLFATKSNTKSDEMRRLV